MTTQEVTDKKFVMRCGNESEKNLLHSGAYTARAVRTRVYYRLLVEKFGTDEQKRLSDAGEIVKAGRHIDYIRYVDTYGTQEEKEQLKSGRLTPGYLRQKISKRRTAERQEINVDPEISETSLRPQKNINEVASDLLSKFKPRQIGRLISILLDGIAAAEEERLAMTE